MTNQIQPSILSHVSASLDYVDASKNARQIMDALAQYGELSVQALADICFLEKGHVKQVLLALRGFRWISGRMIGKQAFYRINTTRILRVNAILKKYENLIR